MSAGLVPDLPVCQQTSFLTAWYVSTSVWYAMAALWVCLVLWPTRRRVGMAIGTIVLLGVLTTLLVLFKQTYHCVLVGASGHALPGSSNPFENPRAFPSLEAGLVAYATTDALLNHAAALPRGYQRTTVGALLAVFVVSLLWFHTAVQVGLSLLLGAVFGAGWQRLVVRALAHFPGAGGAVSSSDMSV